ncbi:MAG: MlaD family protein [Polyangiaceae bacterium]
MKRGRDIKVGLFVLAGLIVSGLVVFLIGDERRLFVSSVEFKTHFSDVQGLRAGAPIRMGGIDIGHVSAVGYGTNPGDTTVYVTLDIVQSEAGRIKTDSVAKVVSKGLLGDKMMEITKGTAPEPIAPGSLITGEEPADMFGKVGDMAAKADAALANIERASEALADERLQGDLRDGIHNLNVVLTHVAKGDGYVTRLLADEKEAARISAALDSLTRTSNELETTLRSVRGITARIEQGPGFAHDVVYGPGPQRQVEQFGDAAAEVATTLKGIRESDSLAHDMVYGGKGDGAEALANFTAITADLRVITGNLKAGKGTIGALLVDPSVYEDVKAVLGNVQRNDVLRALVRYSIKQDEKKAPVQVEGPRP